MYYNLLLFHSWFRWLVLCSLIYMIIRSYIGWKGNKTFTTSDNFLRHSTATIAHIQLTIGLFLYFISPNVKYFLHHFKVAVHEKEPRFFGMEHSFMMVLAVILITIGSAKAKRKETDLEKFKTIAIWFGIALLVILSSLPWPWSPFSAHRPYFRF